MYGPGIDEWFALEAKQRRPVALDIGLAASLLVDNVATALLQACARVDGFPEFAGLKPES